MSNGPAMSVPQPSVTLIGGLLALLFTGLGALGVMHFQHTGVVAHPGTTSMLEGMQAQLLKLERNQERGMDTQQKILERLAVIEREVKLNP